MTACSYEDCDTVFDYDVGGFDDPTEGNGHIEVTYNPADEPSFVVADTRYYCSVSCLLADDEVPDYLREEVDAYCAERFSGCSSIRRMRT